MEALVRVESWPIRGGFRIARGSRDAAEVVVVELRDEGKAGRGECVPYARYGESIDSVVGTVEAVAEGLAVAGARDAIASLPAGAARNALDCALWDLEAKRSRASVRTLLGVEAPPEVVTMRTVSVGEVDAMRTSAHRLADADAIKVKVDGGDDLERINAVHEAAPAAALIVDANESWSVDQTKAWLPELSGLGVVVLEQPLPEGRDDALRRIEHSVPICADESFKVRSSFELIEGCYDLINVKLDKAGGLTEALACVREAERRGIPVMLGCMVSTSLAVEPALLLAPFAKYVDLDGPLLLEADREGALHDRSRGVLKPSSGVWGAA